MEETVFVDILLPVPIAHRFTYRVPRNLSEVVETGMRVAVPFGKNRMLTGIIDTVHSKAPEKYEARYIFELLDETPVFTSGQIRFMDWMAGYYMASSGEVLTAAMPSGLKITTESYIQIHPAADFEDVKGNESLERLFFILQERETLTYAEVQEIVGEKDAFRTLQYLSRKSVIILIEEVKEKYSPKTETYVSLADAYAAADEKLNELFESLSRAPKQEDALLAFLQLTRHDHDHQSINSVPRNALLEKGVSASALQALVKKEILVLTEKIVSRFNEESASRPMIELSPIQKEAAESIIDQFADKDVVLLHGITGSGKTEIYMNLIQHILDNGSQVLYLLPEIALTTQIVQRLKSVFGETLGVYHSRFSDNERVEVWQGVLSGKYQIVVGVRSSVFLPFDHLGLVIVDEEHEHSYKQYDPAPRYHARDSAIMLAALHQAKTLLGSATPSMESRYLADHGKYGYVRLDRRYGDSAMPSIEVVDILRKNLQRKMIGPFSDVLIHEIEGCLERGQQVILFQNRRGYAPYLSCGQCGHIPHCSQCSVSLTYHQYSQKLICHYCGMQESVPSICDACGASEMKTIGVGTEKLEEEVALKFPNARIQRMDLDTTRSKNSFERILNEFAAHQSDILVGTQMVTKGLDFAGVGLVGIIDLDLMLHYPDFRSHERAFQMAIQVSGRAGRRESPGKVIIQTRDVKHPVVLQILNGNYDTFYTGEIKEREAHQYPPFTRMIRVTLKHRDRNVVREGAFQMEKNLSRILPNRILGPQEPLIHRIRNEYLFELWVKLERKDTNPAVAKKALTEVANFLRQQKIFRSLKIVFNVDPY